MVISSITPNSDYSLNDREQYLWNQLDEAERVTDLDLDVFDDVEVDYNLPDNVPAATKHEGSPLYSNTTLAVSEDFFYLPEAEQNHILTHEGVHGNMFNGDLDNQLRDLGLSDESIDFFKKKLNSSESEMEGATEYLTQLLDPNSDRLSLRSYPYETQKIRKEAESEGLDVESEIAEEIEAYTDSILSEYTGREVYKVEVTDDYRLEQGRIGDLHYSSLEIYEDDLEGLLDGDEDYLSEAAEEIQDYMDEMSDRYEAVEEYLTDIDYELEYGEGANYVGNTDQGHEVPLSASMGTPVNGHE